MTHMVDNFNALPAHSALTSATYNQDEKFDRRQGHPHPTKSTDAGKGRLLQTLPINPVNQQRWPL